MATRPPRPPRSRKGRDGYPEPFVVTPKSEHRQTFILLHGRGSNGPVFGSGLLATPLAGSSLTLQEAFPHAKFVFPTASLRRARIYKRSRITQWFDHWTLDAPLQMQELQIDGLRESLAFVHGLMREEIDVVGSGNIVLGGLSQGCAAALVSLLTWSGEPIPAVVGMCGWLPFHKMLQDGINHDKKNSEAAGDDSDGDDPFLRSQEDDGQHVFAEETSVDLGAAKVEIATNNCCSAIVSLFEELDMVPPKIMQMPFLKTPIFLGHGMQDEKVPIERGHEARDCLAAFEVDLTWKTYERLGHWYSGELLADLTQFLKQKTGW
ncbi:MAG: hypothetical protein M1822_001162 [Bathelium mastoideum]|nr:MAG: hypothetical protein M1822_001162 [Bathelium mastoideum]